MRILAFAVLGSLVAFPAFGGILEAIPGSGAEAPVSSVDGACVSDQGATTLDNSLGLQDPANVGINQGPCIPGGAGAPGDLEGFAFPLTSCGDGFVVQSDITMDQRDGDAHNALYHNYIWRDMGGIPNDACGMECAVATNLAIPPLNDHTNQTHDWTAAGCPCITFNGERLHQGVVFELIRPATLGPDFFVSFDDQPAVPDLDRCLVNLSATHGDWVDINGLASQFARPYHVAITIDEMCDGTPVEASTWGAMKNLYR